MSSSERTKARGGIAPLPRRRHLRLVLFHATGRRSPPASSRRGHLPARGAGPDLVLVVAVGQPQAVVARELARDHHELVMVVGDVTGVARAPRRCATR